MPLDDKGNPEPKPPDYDVWLECRNCGSLYNKNEVKKEASLADFVETSENPQIDIRREVKKGGIVTVIEDNTDNTAGTVYDYSS